ncbi:SLAP domain-containing protein [Heliobacterium mobile]|uniref:SLAP domain-containing protein n=1 Tax=Heliobacterium mobile TaxID=28064 RepID=UPI0014796880|nr:SLAP domain-containing protein [Heliobacterium mobile]
MKDTFDENDVTVNEGETENAEVNDKQEGITLEGSFILNFNTSVRVAFNVRNDMAQPVSFGKVPLVLLNGQGKLLGRQIFSLDKLGTLMPGESKPMEVSFKRRNLRVTNIKQDDWVIALEVPSGFDQIPNFMTDETYKRLPAEEKTRLVHLLQSLPPVKETSVKFFPFRGWADYQAVHSMFLIRNGLKQDVKIDKARLTVLDANDRDLGSVLFELDDLLIQAGSGRLWTFSIPKSQLNLEGADMTRWSVVVGTQS